MHSPRAQADKRAYQHYVKCRIEQQENLDLRQETVDDLITETSGQETREQNVPEAVDLRPNLNLSSLQRGLCA